MLFYKRSTDSSKLSDTVLLAIKRQLLCWAMLFCRPAIKRQCVRVAINRQCDVERYCLQVIKRQFEGEYYCSTSNQETMWSWAILFYKWSRNNAKLVLFYQLSMDNCHVERYCTVDQGSSQTMCSCSHQGTVWCWAILFYKRSMNNAKLNVIVKPTIERLVERYCSISDQQTVQS